MPDLNILNSNAQQLNLIYTWKKKGQKIVFTNGCFDILHAGHISYLREAKAIGDKLVVGLNSDESIRAIKGADRPVQNLYSRFSVLNALQSVDAVIVFSAETPLKIIQMVKPDFLIKGADWKVEQIVGADFVQSYGGEVKNIPILKGYSSSAIIKKIKGQ